MYLYEEVFMKKIYYVEFVRYFYYDENDQEDVETRYTVGYFTSLDLANKAIEECIKESKLDRSEFKIQEFNIECGNNQKYLYVLWYEFSLLDEEGDYLDYYYNFEPCSTKKKCLDLKKELIRTKKVKILENAIYYDSKDGFCVSKEKINQGYIIHP